MRLFRSETGFSLIEVLVATTVLAVAVAGLAELSATAARANTTAGTITSTSILASQKMEQLRALTWGWDERAMPLSDTTTDITVSPARPNAGVGLSPSPPGTLEQNTAGYCDFLDAAGQWAGSGTVPPAAAVFVRRWSVAPLPLFPADTLVLQVIVTRAVRAAPGRPPPDAGLLVSVKSRKAW